MFDDSLGLWSELSPWLGRVGGEEIVAHTWKLDFIIINLI